MSSTNWPHSPSNTNMLVKVMTKRSIDEFEVNDIHSESNWMTYDYLQHDILQTKGCNKKYTNKDHTVHHLKRGPIKERISYTMVDMREKK